MCVCHSFQFWTYAVYLTLPVEEAPRCLLPRFMNRRYHRPTASRRPMTSSCNRSELLGADIVDEVDTIGSACAVLLGLGLGLPKVGRMVAGMVVGAAVGGAAVVVSTSTGISSAISSTGPSVISGSATAVPGAGLTTGAGTTEPGAGSMTGAGLTMGAGKAGGGV